MPYCSVCGSNLEERGNYCYKCGAPVNKNIATLAAQDMPAHKAETLQASPGKVAELEAYMERKSTDHQFSLKLQKCINDQELDRLLMAEGFSITSKDIKTLKENTGAPEDGSITDANRAEKLKGELRGWGIALIILGILHFVLSEFLSPTWGAIILVIGLANLIVISHHMFIVNGLALVVVGLMNIIGTLDAGVGGWLVFGCLQILWGIREFSKFKQYAPTAITANHAVHMSIHPKTGFVFLLIAAFIECTFLILESSFWLFESTFGLNFIFWPMRPVISFMVSLLFVAGIIIINGLFQTARVKSINTFILMGTSPFLIIRLLVTLDQNITFLYGMPWMITESVFFLMLTIGAFYYYYNNRVVARLIQAIFFTVIFLSIAIFYALSSVYFDVIYPVFATAMAVSCIFIIGCSVYFLTNTANQRMVYPK